MNVQIESENLRENADWEKRVSRIILSRPTKKCGSG